MYTEREVGNFNASFKNIKDPKFPKFQDVPDGPDKDELEQFFKIRINLFNNISSY